VTHETRETFYKEFVVVNAWIHWQRFSAAISATVKVAAFLGHLDPTQIGLAVHVSGELES